jgi:hypothetical protein
MAAAPSGGVDVGAKRRSSRAKGRAFKMSRTRTLFRAAHLCICRGAHVHTSGGLVPSFHFDRPACIAMKFALLMVYNSVTELFS